MAGIAEASEAGTQNLGDLDVVRMGFGAMRLTGPGIWGPPRDREEARRVLRRVAGLGINLIDTADAYGPFVSEEIIAEALYPYPAGLVIATKGGLLREGPGRWRPDGRPEHLRRACEGSLKRLRTDRIELYQLHRPDPAVPLEDSLGALLDLQLEGKIHHLGVCNVTVAQLVLARDLAGIVSVQNRFSLFDRSSEQVLEQCERDALTFLPWAPLGGGEQVGALSGFAARRGATAPQIALAWLLMRSPRIAVIPGTASIEHLEENVDAARLRLSEDDFDALDSVTRRGSLLGGAAAEIPSA